MTILCIDPGITAVGMAVLTRSGRPLTMDTIRPKADGMNRINEIVLDVYSSFGPAETLIIEQPPEYSRAGKNVGSLVKLALAAGAIASVAHSLRVPVHWVIATDWMRSGRTQKSIQRIRAELEIEANDRRDGWTSAERSMLAQASEHAIAALAMGRWWMRQNMIPRP